MKEITRQDLLDILQGVAVLGGGGGGQIAEGQRLIEKAFPNSTSIPLLSLKEITDHTILCCPFRMGSVTDPFEHNHTVGPIIAALRAMETRIGKTIHGFIPVETGPVNTILSFYIAGNTQNGFVVDADPMGRSVPELKQSMLWSSDLPPRSIALASATGETFLKDGLVNAEEAEQVLRPLCVKYSGLCGVDHALPKGDIAAKLAGGTVSQALRIGVDLRKAKENGVDAAETIAAKHSGKVVFRGVITRVEEMEGNGFAIGSYMMKGSGEFEGRTYRVEYKNENMVGWLDEEISVTVPEIISLINGSGDVAVNPGQKVGDVGAVVVLPSPEHYLTEKGLRMFGPSYCGLDQEFRSALK